MCGIIGFIGEDNASDILIKGLKALEYRGYDSSGVALGDDGKPKIIKSAGRISVLEEKLASASLPVFHRGIAHTRWATHGGVSDLNSHPHSSDSLSLVHNGIIENYYELESMLRAEGYTFSSETDTEAALTLIDYEYRRLHDPEKAIFKAISGIRGSFAFAIIFNDVKEKIYAVRRQSPLIAAHTNKGSFIASDVTALLPYTKDIYRPEDDVLIILSKDKTEFKNQNGDAVYPISEHVDWDEEEAQKGGFPHFMLKEISEIPDSVRKTVSSYLADGIPYFDAASLKEDNVLNIGRIHVSACGTAMHAGLIGKRLIEELAHIPVNIETASEFRCRSQILDKRDLMIVLSQSGETADTLSSLAYAKERGVNTLAIVNVFGSSIARSADDVIYTKAGPEIAVASTKAYTVQCAVLALIALHLARIKKRMTVDEVRVHTRLLSSSLPTAIEKVISESDGIKDAASDICNAEHLFFIGRGSDSDVCAEGSLKLKEISYIHSEAYPAGELKHGTISLISDGIPVIACACNGDTCDKMISSIREVRSRGARVTVLTTNKLAKSHAFPCDRIITVDDEGGPYTFLTAASAMQLLAYHVSAKKGLDVDKPRNLAKSVTVE